MKNLIMKSVMLLVMLGSTVTCAEQPGAILEAEIMTMPFHSYGAIPDRIQPGSQVKLSLKIKNVGNEENAPGTIYIRFLFAKPLETQKNSLLFNTEKLTLPPIKPGEEVTLAFSKMHKWPSVFDFVRDDWAMRRYQAVATIDGREYVIGSRSIAFSAYYYEGPNKRIPISVPGDR